MGNQQSVMTENLIKEIQTYYEHYLTIRNEVDLHDELFTMTLKEQGIENWNRAPFFFGLVFNALSDSFSMSLARLFDKSGKAKSMMSLITKCKKNISLFQNPKDVQSKLEAFEQELMSDQMICGAIPALRDRRDKLYAHNDKKYFVEPEKVLQQPVHMYQIWMLLDKIDILLNALLSELSATIPSQSKRYRDHSDLKNLLGRN